MYSISIEVTYDKDYESDSYNNLYESDDFFKTYKEFKTKIINSILNKNKIIFTIKIYMVGIEFSKTKTIQLDYIEFGYNYIDEEYYWCNGKNCKVLYIDGRHCYSEKAKRK